MDGIHYDGNTSLKKTLGKPIRDIVFKTFGLSIIYSLNVSSLPTLSLIWKFKAKSLSNVYIISYVSKKSIDVDFIDLVDGTT